MTARERYSNLDFDQLLDKLAGCAGSELTHSLIRSVEVVFHPARIDANLDETGEALSFVDDNPSVELPAFGQVTDLGGLWERMAAGEMVDSQAARQLLSFYAVCADFDRVLKHITLDRFPRLTEAAAAWQPLDQLTSLSARTFSEDGEVRDAASRELARVRSQLRRFESQVTRTIRESFSGTREQAGEDVQVTIRGNRFVVMVPRAVVGSHEGAVVDFSGSGQSVYFEPACISALNTERQDLFLAERQEVRRILADYSQQTAMQLPQLTANLAILVRFDYILARARFARALRANRPELSLDHGFALNGACHPLLMDDFVPEDLVFDAERCLVISGVNAGGKTVLLKLLGLYSLMAALGCYVPGEAALPYVGGVLADIGDDQNALANLSTFTAHLRFIQDLWGELAARDSGEPPLLVLIDEIGTGTEPGEGAAFAYGLIDSLLGLPVKLAVTTHYDVLKTLAFERPDVKNVCLEFDREQLKPTFRILDGQPGQSFALAIARQWGVAKSILATAETVIGQEERKMGAIIGELEDLRHEAEKQRGEAAQQAAELKRATLRNAELTDELKQAKLKFARHVERVRQELEQRIDELLAETKQKLKKKARQSTRKHDEYVKAASKSSGVARRQKDEVEQLVAEALDSLAIDDTEDGSAVEQLVIGQSVQVTGAGLRGEVLELDADRKVGVITVSGKRMTVPLDRLRPAEQAAQPPADPLKAYRAGQVPPSRRQDDLAAAMELQNSSDTLDLHGQTIEEAAESLDAFLSRCLLAGVSTIRIMHGLGTGRLRQYVREHLGRSRHVRNIRPAKTQEGGVGITLADLA